MILTVRKATREDAKAIGEVRKAAILHQCVTHYPADALETWTQGELSKGFADIIEKHFYVATCNDRIIGTGMVNLEAGRVDGIFVDPDRMRKGTGKGIMGFLENLALSHGLKMLTLDSTLNAAPFYRACGFEGSEVGLYRTSSGLSLECIPMVKILSHKSVTNRTR